MMTKLTNGQIDCLNTHLANVCSDRGVLIGDLGARTKRGNLKKNQRIAGIRRDLVAHLRNTVWFEKSGEMAIGRHDRIDTDVPISYPVIARMLFFADHTAALRAHQQRKRESLAPNVTGAITPEEVDRCKPEVRGLETSASVV